MPWPNTIRIGFFALVALSRACTKRGADDLPTTGEVALAGQLLLNLIADAGLRETVAEQPDEITLQVS